MKKKWIIITLGMVLAVNLTACNKTEKTEKQIETQITETETETQTTEETTTEEETTEKKTEAVTKSQTETKKQSNPQTEAPAQIQNQPQTEATVQASSEAPASVQPEMPVQVNTDVQQNMTDVTPVYEEEYMQCPYCGEWFYAQPDGGLWNPYDRHVLSERDRIEGGYEAESSAEQAMAQCPDCLNWYETGNIFRNHICSGR